MMNIFFFFFSSRRRHTRCSRDWSSDVCSSDLSRGVNAREETDERRDGTPSPPRAESGVDSGNGFSARTTARCESANGLQVSRPKAELADSRKRGRKCRPVGQPARPPGDRPQEAAQPNVRKMSDEEQL